MSSHNTSPIIQWADQIFDHFSHLSSGYYLNEYLLKLSSSSSSSILNSCQRNDQNNQENLKIFYNNLKRYFSSRNLFVACVLDPFGDGSKQVEIHLSLLLLASIETDNQDQMFLDPVHFRSTSGSFPVRLLFISDPYPFHFWSISGLFPIHFRSSKNA